MAVGTRSTPVAGNDATNDNTAGGGGSVNMTGGSLSAGTGSATLGYMLILSMRFILLL